MDYKIENRSPEKIRIQKQGHIYILDYGLLTYAQDSAVYINITTSGKDFKAESSCGCTTPEHVELGEDVHQLKISYDTRIPGEFVKKIWFRYTKNSSKRLVEFQIRGNVKK